MGCNCIKIAQDNSREMKSKTSHAVLDIKSRKEKASEIIRILGNYKNIKDCRILDIGTGAGVIASELGKAGKRAYSVDVVDERIIKKNFAFRKIKNEALPFGSEEFDIIVSNHVMAHARNGELHLKEIRRVLKKDGIAYLSMLNRLWPLEPNFNLLFLSWLPKRLADLYVRLMGKGDNYNVNPLAYWNFIGKLEKGFSYDDVTNMLISRKIALPELAYKMFRIFSPVWVFVLKRKD